MVQVRRAAARRSQDEYGFANLDVAVAAEQDLVEQQR